MKLLKLLKLFCIGAFYILPSLSSTAQIRFIDTVFDEFDSIPNIMYRQSFYEEGDTALLYFDLYQAVNDTMQKRPLVIWLHGGFGQGTRKEEKILYFSERLAKRGYLCASVDYRGNVFTDETTMNPRFEAIYRGVQDVNAAISFFKEHAEIYKIDTSRIIVGGMSSGAYVSLHAAYLDQNEVPDTLIDTSAVGALIETQTAFSSTFQIAVNCWGAILDTNWIETGDKPVLCIVGLKDVSVPIEYDTLSMGSYPIYRTAARNDIRAHIETFADAGHGLRINPSEDMSMSEANTKQYGYLDIACADMAYFFSDVLYNTYEESNDSTLSIHYFPNPTSSKLNLRIYNAILSNIIVSVHDAYGNQVLSLSEQTEYDHIYKKEIDLSNLPGGTYYIRIDKSSKFLNKKYLCKIVKF